MLPPGAILASNTSTISITRMAEVGRSPENFAGMHFFNPVDRMQLVEVIRGDKTGDATVATLVALAKRIGKTPIVVRDCPGFLVNRILFPYMNEVAGDAGGGGVAAGTGQGGDGVRHADGADHAQRPGRTGHVACTPAGVINTAFADRASTTRILDELVAAGRLGQKTGAGFYSYAKGSRGGDDPALAGYPGEVPQGPRARSAWRRSRTGCSCRC